ncbi:MAG: hypothetical protein WCX65_07750 [bacterium]
MKRKFEFGLVVLLACSIVAIAGCGGGGGDSIPLSGARITVRGYARAPQNSGIARTASRSAEAAQGLLPVTAGTPVAVYFIDNSGAIIGSAVASGAVAAGGTFSLVLPAEIRQIASDMVVAVGAGADLMRAFIINTSNLSVDPNSEAVVYAITNKCTSPLIAYSMDEIIIINEQYNSAVNSENIDYSVYDSVDSAVTGAISNTGVKGTIYNMATTAGGSCEVLNPNPQTGDNWGEETEEEDAFGNIMKTTFTTINSVDFTAPAANAPCNVSANITFTDEDGESSITSVKLIYYLNGNLSAEHAVAMSTSNGWIYTGQIPGQTAGTTVDFIIRTEDSNGNVTSNAVSSATNLIQAIPDIDNSPDIVENNADLLGFSANYDSQYLYVSYNVQGTIVGGTTDPPYLMLYGIKITNPDQAQGEGLMVGDLWINMPLAMDPVAQDQFVPLFFGQASGEGVEQNRAYFEQTGMMALNIQRLMGGNFTEGFISVAEPEGTSVGGTFTGKIKLAAFGDNPSGYLRIIVLTAANLSLDSFMPIPLNCSHFLTIYRSSYGYTVN